MTEPKFNEFAKASLVNLVIQRVEAEHPELLPESTLPPDTIRQAHYAAQKKKDLLENILGQTGPAFLLGIGQHLDKVQLDPILTVALNSTSPDVFFQKWSRFERYAHSQNRLDIRHREQATVSFARRTVNGSIPSNAENFLVCGVIIGILESIGCRGLYCDVLRSSGPPIRIRQNGGFTSLGQHAHISADRWEIGWQSFAPKKPVQSSPPQYVDMILKTIVEPDTKALVAEVCMILCCDVSRLWRVEEVAKTLNTSVRSMQRKLQLAGLSFSSLMRIFRVYTACHLLETENTSITIIGFCSGFSDSAQFSSDFRSSVGMSPTEYRALCTS